MLPFLLVFLFAYDGYTQTINCSGDCDCPSSGTTTCTLRCIGTDKCKDGRLTCRSGSPCNVICDGNNACSGNSQIDASGATDVSITCTGTDACKGNTVINCGTGDCAISCSSSSSCENTDINAPNANSFTCSGSCSPASAPAPFTAPPTPKPTTTKIPTPKATPKPTTKSPTPKPTTESPTIKPTNNPTKIPTDNPIVTPTNNPIQIPTTYPTKNPTYIPSYNPTVSPTKYPTHNPSNTPTTPIPSSRRYPTDNPISSVPSTSPSQSPTTQQHGEVNEETITDAPVDDELDVNSNIVSNDNQFAHLDAWVYIMIACTVIFCCLMTLLVLFKCGVIKRQKQNKFEHRVADMNNMYGMQSYDNNHRHNVHEQSDDSEQPQVVGRVKSIPLTIEGDVNSTYNSNLKNALAIISGNSRQIQNFVVPSDEEVSTDSNEPIVTLGGPVLNNNDNNKEVQMANKSEKVYNLEGMGIDNINTGDMEMLDAIDQIADTLVNGDEFTIHGDDEETIYAENDDEIDDIPNSNEMNRVNSFDFEDNKMTIGSENIEDEDVDADDIIQEMMTPPGNNVVENDSNDSEEEYITIQ